MTSAKGEDGPNSLRALIELQGPVESLLGYTNPIMSQPARTVVFERIHALNAINRFLAGELEASQISAWAEVVHSQEWIDYEAGNDDHLTQFLYEVSTPELFGDLTEYRAREWIEHLSS